MSVPLLAIALLVPQVAAAQEPSETETAAARALFEEALGDYEHRRYATAARKFEQVYGMMDGHPRQYLVLYNLGECLADAGEYDAAIERFAQYLEEGGEQIENRGQVERRIVELEGLRARGEGEDVPAATPQMVSPPSASSGPDEGLLIGGVAALGVGVLGLAGMGIFGGLALSEHDSLAAGCGASMTCTPDDIQTSDTFALVADVNLGVGAVGIVTGAILLAVALASGGDSTESALRLRPGRNGAAGEAVIRW